MLNEMYMKHKESYARTIKSLDTASSLLFLYTIDNNKEELHRLINSLNKTNEMLDTLNNTIEIFENSGVPDDVRLIALDIINYSHLVTTIGDLLLNYKPNRIIKRLKEMKAMNNRGKPETTKEIKQKIDKVLTGLISIYERN